MKDDLWIYGGANYSKVLDILIENASCVAVQSVHTIGSVSIAMSRLAIIRSKPVAIMIEGLPWVVVPGDPPERLKERWYQYLDAKKDVAIQ